MSTEVSSTLLRSIAILNYLSGASGPQNLTNISKMVNLSPTSAHRLLATLKMEGLVFQDPNSKMYSLGFAFLQYANKVLADIPIAPVINPWLIKLREQTGETVGYYVPSGIIRICVLEHESQQEIRRGVGVGRTHPIYMGASGRAILAFQSSDFQNKVLSTLSLDERKRIEEMLQVTVEQGYSINEEEITANVGALSAPVFNHKQQLLGAVSISGPLFRWNRETMQKHIPSLKEACRQITKILE